MKRISYPLALIAMLISGTALAVPVNGTGNVSSKVFFGLGNGNGGWTGVNDTTVGIEVALRGKLRYDLNGDPQDIFNYDGDRTYTFDPANSNAPSDRAIFNIEFSVNSDTFLTGTANRNVNDIIWSISIDGDPSATNTPIFPPFDFINGNMPDYADHSFGDENTEQSMGQEAPVGDTAAYFALRAGNNVAQNSTNLGFLLPNVLNPTADPAGAWDIYRTTEWYSCWWPHRKHLN